jgi:hypothetical protein
MALSTPDDAPKLERRVLPWWATSLLGPTTLVAAVYLVLYQAAHAYYGRFGITPEQAGLAHDAVAGGALEFALVYVGLLIPGALLALTLSRRILESRGRIVWIVVTVALMVGALVGSALIRRHSASLVLVLVVYCPLLGGGGAFLTLLFREAAPLLPGSVEQARAFRARWLRPMVSVAAVLLLPFLAIQLWTAAGTAGGDVLRRGGSTRAFYVMPIEDLLGVRPVAVSPCLINLGADNTPVHLRAAVIVGHSAGRTYLVGVAGPAGFRGIPVGHVTTFSVADSDLGPLDLDLEAPKWDTTPHPVDHADTRTCQQALSRS